jgi:hypothetical protein
VATGAEDYHLVSGSAPINAGVVTTITVDRDGKARDSMPDIGAYEFGAR